VTVAYTTSRGVTAGLASGGTGHAAGGGSGPLVAWPVWPV